MNHFGYKAAKILVFSAGITVLMAATALAGEIGTNMGAVTGSSVRMRSEANTSSSVVMTLDKGASVSILATQDGWCKVSYSGNTGYISSDYIVVDQDGIFTSYGTANTDGINVRAAASADSSTVGSIDSGASVTVTGFSDGWYSVTCQYGTAGYIRSDFLDLTASPSSSDLGSTLVSTAKQYLGTRYSYGGASPSGFDCSGFTMYIYQQFGYSLPHTATGQWQSGVGTRVYSPSALQTGDLVFFCDPSRSNGKACSHAGIYIGDGQFIHASSASSGGVVTSSLYKAYYSSYFVGGRHIV